jgi:hypothetical protein
VAINIVGVFGKNVWSLGKIVVSPEKFFDSQNGTLTENFFGDGGGEVGEKNFKAKSGRKGPPAQNMAKGPVFLRYATGHTISFISFTRVYHTYYAFLFLKLKRRP